LIKTKALVTVTTSSVVLYLGRKKKIKKPILRVKDLRKKILIKNESKTLARYPGRCVSDMPYANEDHQGK
jgi:hypothetical protein